MIVYHGSNVEVVNPLINSGRSDADFGKGFYVTEDREMAERWSAKKYRRETPQAIVNVYEIDISQLIGLRFHLDRDWLDFVYQNRNQLDLIDIDVSRYDYLMGATADDRLFAVLRAYREKDLTPEEAIECLNMMKVGIQIALVSETAIKNLNFVKSYKLSAECRKAIKSENDKMHKEANEIVNRILYRNRPKRRKMKTAETVLPKNVITDQMNSF